MKKLIIASNNQGKIREFKQILEPLGYEVMSQSEAGVCIDAEEIGNTLNENARIKAKAVFDLIGTAVIADDSGLEVDELGGEPGVYSARYAPEGQRKKTVLKKLEGVPKENRTARFVCCICYMDEDGEKLIRGECEGYIGHECRGGNGFGYDSVFMVGDESFAEISEERKNKISHRGVALRELAWWLKSGKSENNARIAVFGGAFGPPHTGHVKLVKSICETIGADKILIIPTGNAAHKTSDAAFDDRFEMAKLAFSALPFCEVLGIEKSRAEHSYTIDTLRKLRTLYPESRFFLIIGGDSLADFHKWKNCEQIPELCTVIAGGRDGTSSTAIREKLSKGEFETAADVIPAEVLEYIERRGIYV